MGGQNCQYTNLPLCGCHACVNTRAKGCGGGVKSQKVSTYFSGINIFSAGE